jgi:hypothetical protein
MIRHMTDLVVSRYQETWRQPPAPDLRDPATRRQLSNAAVTASAAIFGLWGLSSAAARDLLGGISARTWERWRESPGKVVLDQDQLTRASLVIGIHRALRTLYSTSYADAWPTLVDTHPLFDGQTPVAAMARGGIPTMQATRQLLDGWRGGR